MKTKLLVLLFGLLLAVLPSNTRAYSYDRYAGSVLSTIFGEDLTMHYINEEFPFGSGRVTALEQARVRWNINPSVFGFGTGTRSPVGFGDLSSDIWFSIDDEWLCGAPAITYGWAHFSGGVWNLFEADILIDQTRSWETSSAQSDAKAYGIVTDVGGDNSRSLQTVLLHEFGHALGLNHEDRYYNIMGQDWDHIAAYNGTVYFMVGEDACNGAVAMYGRNHSYPKEDVGVSHWKYATATLEGYSAHNRCRIYRADNSNVETLQDDEIERWDSYFDPIFKVSKGHTIKVEMTFENNGYAETVSPRVRFYFSQDSEFDAGDDVVATIEPSLKRNTPFTFSTEMVVPSSGVTTGNIYYIIAFVDYSDDITEATESNNKAYVKVYIK